MNAITLFTRAKEELPPEFISDQGECGSDLYLKVCPESTKLIKQYDFSHLVTRFKSQIDGELWYEIPFGNTDWWERHCGKGSCGKIQK